MNQKYAPFVALASLKAYQQLSDLLKRWNEEPSRALIEDAARFGQQKALELMFPGLIKIPFVQDPTRDVVLSLRYMYEEDPEGLSPESHLADTSSALAANSAPTQSPEDTQQLSDTAVRALKRAAQLKSSPSPSSSMSDSSVRRSRPNSRDSSQVLKLSASDLRKEGLLDEESSSRRERIPASSRYKLSTASAVRINKAEVTERPGVSNSDQAPTSQSNLRKIDRPSGSFPWEKPAQGKDSGSSFIDLGD